MAERPGGRVPGARDIVVTLALLSASIVLVLYTGHVLSGLGIMRRGMVRREAELVRARRLAASEERLAAEIEHLKALIRNYERALPTDEELAEFFSELDEIAAESNIVFDNVSERAWAPAAHYWRAYRTIELRSGYHELGRFIGKLESLDRFVRVDEISIDADPSYPGEHIVRFVVSTFVAGDDV